MPEQKLFAILLKINLKDDQNVTIDDAIKIEMRNSICQLSEPFYSFLQCKNVRIKYFTSGLHTNGKKKMPHIHAHFICEMEEDEDGKLYPIPQNLLTNYKYHYSISYGETLKTRHFKMFKHSIRCVIQEKDKLTGSDDIKNVLAYPYKEIIDPNNKWKLGEQQQIPEFTTQEELVTRGAGIYLQSIRKNIKIEQTEKTKLEKWGEFCLFMDALRETPTKHKMDTLRGVCIVALEYHRERSERTSVNAVITMCKDYAFKRNIWTNNEILDKYYII